MPPKRGIKRPGSSISPVPKKGRRASKGFSATVERGLQWHLPNSSLRPSPPLVLVLVGPPGCGKSTFAEHLGPAVKDAARLRSKSAKTQLLSGEPWRTVCQDVLGSQGAASRVVASCLKLGLSVVIDQPNCSFAQRDIWLKIALSHRAKCHCLIFDVPLNECCRRNAARDSREGRLRGSSETQTVRAYGQLENVLDTEAFSRVKVVRTRSDIDAEAEMYRGEKVGGPVDPSTHHRGQAEKPETLKLKKGAPARRNPKDEAVFKSAPIVGGLGGLLRKSRQALEVRSGDDGSPVGRAKSSTGGTVSPGSAASNQQLAIAWPFSPKYIDVTRCMARTWADGSGGQCNKLATEDGLCNAHMKALAHGRLDGPIPDQKLAEFVRTQERRARRASDPQSPDSKRNGTLRKFSPPKRRSSTSGASIASSTSPRQRRKSNSTTGGVESDIGDGWVSDPLEAERPIKRSPAIVRAKSKARGKGASSRGRGKALQPKRV